MADRGPEECNCLNALFRLFELDAYLWFGASNEKPFYLSWRRKVGGKLHHRWFRTVDEADTYAKKVVFKRPTA